jgi:hypothetical protein
MSRSLETDREVAMQETRAGCCRDAPEWPVTPWRFDSGAGRDFGADSFQGPGVLVERALAMGLSA